MVIVAWTEREGELAVRWTTGFPVIGAEVKYRERECGGKMEMGEWRSSLAEHTSFDSHPAPVSYTLNTAFLTSLRPDCVYEYTVGTGIVVSDVRSVSGRTPIYTDRGRDAFNVTRFVVYGDMGTGSSSQIARTHLKQFIASERIAAILHLGDIAYSLDFQSGTTGDHFLNELQGVCDSVPYMVAPGNMENHDNFTHYKERFRMPRTEENQGGNTFYSFDVGAAHVLIYNTEVLKYGTDIEVLNQRRWLIDDLTKANSQRDKVPWIIVAGHKPLYCNIDWTLPLELNELTKNPLNLDCFTETSDLRNMVEDIFYQYKVDVVLSSHVHKYEREAAIYRNQTVESEKDERNLHYNARAPIYLITGAMGNRLGMLTLSHTPQLWNRFESLSFGFGELTVFNGTHLLWEEYSSVSQTVIDHLWVVKSRPSYDTSLLSP